MWLAPAALPPQSSQTVVADPELKPTIKPMQPAIDVAVYEFSFAASGMQGFSPQLRGQLLWYRHQAGPYDLLICPNCQFVNASSSQADPQVPEASLEGYHQGSLVTWQQGLYQSHRGAPLWAVVLQKLQLQWPETSAISVETTPWGPQRWQVSYKDDGELWKIEKKLSNIMEKFPEQKEILEKECEQLLQQLQQQGSQFQHQILLALKKEDDIQKRYKQLLHHFQQQCAQNKHHHQDPQLNVSHQSKQIPHHHKIIILQEQQDLLQQQYEQLLQQLQHQSFNNQEQILQDLQQDGEIQKQYDKLLHHFQQQCLQNQCQSKQSQHQSKQSQYQSKQCQHQSKQSQHHSKQTQHQHKQSQHQSKQTQHHLHDLSR